MAKDIIHQGFDMCPHCGTKMFYFTSILSLSLPDDVGGRHIKAVLNERKTVKAVCPTCKASYDMVGSILGITTPQFSEYQEYVNSRDKYDYTADTSIGYIKLD